VQNFAAQAVIAIENARLLNELRESLEQQTATSNVLGVISSSPGELQPVYEAMLQNALRLCDARFGNIYRWDGEVANLVASYNTPAALIAARKSLPLRPQPDEPLGRIIASNAPEHIADLAAERAYAERKPAITQAVELGGIRTLLAVPMRREDELIGALTIYRQEVRPFTDKQIALVQNFADQAVIAIENTRLLNELRERTSVLPSPWSSRLRRRRCCESYRAHPANLLRYSTPCWRMPRDFATPPSDYCSSTKATGAFASSQ
jgi:GAF domain-containing protein